MQQTDENLALEAALAIIESSTDFRVLRRLPFPPRDLWPIGSDLFTGIVLDVETTGLDAEIDEVIELGMIRFEFDRTGRIGSNFSTFQAFNEPKRPIPEDIIRLTGIRDEDVAGQKIEGTSIADFVAGASLIIAHNAAFDRPFAKSMYEGFADLAWGCTATEIDWRSEGISGGRLEYITASFGYFYDAHRAIDDCSAVVNILSFQLPRSKALVLGPLLAAARRVETRVCAEGAAYDLRLPLKRAGYRWNDGLNGFPRAWFKDVPTASMQIEITFLEKLGRGTITPVFYRMSAKTRFRRLATSAT